MKEPKTGEVIGIIRNMDDLGRIVIPKELRKTLDINAGDALEIFATKNGFFIRKVKQV